MKTKGIGINVPIPDGPCEDDKCPFHGPLTVRGRIYEGVVQSTGMRDSVVIRRDYLYKIKKYDRYERRHGKVSAHVPQCMGNLKIGQKVRAMECRPLSKTISFVVIELVEN